MLNDSTLGKSNLRTLIFILLTFLLIRSRREFVSSRDFSLGGRCSFDFDPLLEVEVRFSFDDCTLYLTPFTRDTIDFVT